MLRGRKIFREFFFIIITKCLWKKSDFWVAVDLDSYMNCYRANRFFCAVKLYHMVCLWESGLQGSCTPRNMSSHMFKSDCLQDVYPMKNQLMRLLLTLALFYVLQFWEQVWERVLTSQTQKEEKAQRKDTRRKVTSLQTGLSATALHLHWCLITDFLSRNQ